MWPPSSSQDVGRHAAHLPFHFLPAAVLELPGLRALSGRYEHTPLCRSQFHHQSLSLQCWVHWAWHSPPRTSGECLSHHFFHLETIGLGTDSRTSCMPARCSRSGMHTTPALSSTRQNAWKGKINATQSLGCPPSNPSGWASYHRKERGLVGEKKKSVFPLGTWQGTMAGCQERPKALGLSPMTQPILLLRLQRKTRAHCPA